MGKGKNRSPREKQRARRAGESDRRREGVGRASLEREKIKNKIKKHQISDKNCSEGDHDPERASRR